MSQSSEDCGNYYDDAVYHKHPNYINNKDRLESFHHWPKKSKKCSSKLSKAGFFYTGLGHQVTCFSCGQLWITNKSIKYRHSLDYWTEHALLSYYKKCDHVIAVKGTDFIDEAWTEDRRNWLRNFEARKRREQRKAEREEKKKKNAEQTQKEMKNESNEIEMIEIPTDQQTI